MKIHKKILTHYLSCTSPVDKEGYLYKMKERTATYHRRWFVLKGNVLFYQQRPADRHLLGVIVLEGCAVRRRGDDDDDDDHDEDPHGPLCFSMVFQAPGLRAYRFAADDRLARESWVKALLSASHCYLSLLLRDLGHQYQEAKRGQAHVEEIRGCCSSSSSSTSTSGSSPARGTHHPYHQHHHHQYNHHQHHQYQQQQQQQVQLRPCSLPTLEGATPQVRDGRSYSVVTMTTTTQGGPSFPAKLANKNKSPWLRRNAHVTPLNGPAPLYGEWPPVGLDPLEEFSKLHEYYGEEVLQAREAWLRRRQVREEEEEEEHEHRCDDDADADDDEVLIDF